MINIKNIYYMLAYAFQVLNEKGYENFSTEEFENIYNLLGAILSKGIANQVKKGLNKEYIVAEELLSSPRGKINISETIKCDPTLKKLVCARDDFSENTYANRILKSVSLLLIKSDEVDKKIKQSLKHSLDFFGNIHTIQISEINWNRVNYDRNNASYRMLINICYLIIKGLLVSDKSNKVKFLEIFDEQNMHRLYEKFILEYYKRHYPFLKPAASYISWNEDNSSIEFLPIMKSDITLKYLDYTLIIDAKYYSRSMQTSMYGKNTIHSNNLYQIYTYVKNMDKNKSGKVSGMLLYARTDESLTPDFKYSFDGNEINVGTLDLDNQFSEISKSLDNIVTTWQNDLLGRKIVSR